MRYRNLFFIAITMITASLAEAWDLPASFDITKMYFNHNTTSHSNDGYNLYDNINEVDVTLHEWWFGSDNKPVCYVKGTTPTVKVEFNCTVPDQDFTSLGIEADYNASSSGQSWSLGEQTVTFSDFSSGWITYNATGSVGNNVGEYDIVWDWKVVKKDGGNQNPPVSIEQTSKEYYVIYSAHKTMQYDSYPKPWTEMVDLACNWAQGESTESGCVAEISSGLYSWGDIQYGDGDTGKTSTSYIKLKTFLSYIHDHDPAYLNCEDFSHFLNVLNASIGIETKYYHIGTTFTHHYLLPAGAINTVYDDDWNFHQICFYGNNVADASTMIDTDGDPSDFPIEWTLSKGDLSWSTYKAALTDNALVTPTQYTKTEVYNQ